MSNMALTGKQDRREKLTKSFINTLIGEFFIALIGSAVLGYSLAGGDLNHVTLQSVMDTFADPFFDPSKFFASFMIGLIAFVGMAYMSWSNYERMKNTRLNEEHGSSSMMKASDMPGFNQNFFYDPKIVGKIEGWAGTKKEKKMTIYNKEQLKKTCKGTSHKKPVFDACFANSQIMGQDVYLSMNCKFINRNLNTLTVGGSGQGKSYSELIPNAMNANSNYIFTDPSGEVLQKVGTYLRKQGYTIKVFNVDEFEKSQKYNPLAYVSTEKDYNTLVDALNKNIKPGKKGGGGNEFFDDAKDSLMCALFALLKELYPVVPITDQMRKDMSESELKELEQRNLDNSHKQTLKNVMRLLLMAEQESKQTDEGEVVTSTLDELFNKLVQHDPRSYAAAQWKSFKVGGPKVCNEVIISAAAVFGRFFNTDDLEWLTCEDELHLEELASEKKCALFLVTPQDTTTYNFMVSMIYSQLFGIVMKEGKNYRDSHGLDNPALPRHLSFWLDEFANVGKIPNFLELLSVVRKYNISINIIIQGMAQLKGLYKENEWEVILANLDTMIYLGGMEPSTVKWLSEKMGKETIKQISSNKNAKSAGESYSNLGRSLMTTDEIEQMSRAFELVFISGCKPIQTKKYDLSKHPNAQKCGEINPKFNFNINDPKIKKYLKLCDEIDYELLDGAALTTDALNSFNFDNLTVKAGHTKGVVIPDDIEIADQETLLNMANEYGLEVTDAMKASPRALKQNVALARVKHLAEQLNKNAENNTSEESTTESNAEATQAEEPEIIDGAMMSEETRQNRKVLAIKAEENFDKPLEECIDTSTVIKHIKGDPGNYEISGDTINDNVAIDLFSAYSENFDSTTQADNVDTISSDETEDDPDKFNNDDESSEDNSDYVDEIPDEDDEEIPYEGDLEMPLEDIEPPDLLEDAPDFSENAESSDDDDFDSF